MQLGQRQPRHFVLLEGWVLRGLDGQATPEAAARREALGEAAAQKWSYDSRRRAVWQ